MEAHILDSIPEQGEGGVGSTHSTGFQPGLAPLYFLSPHSQPVYPPQLLSSK